MTEAESPLTFEDSRSIISALGDERSKVVLIGGQAVNAWAGTFIEQSEVLRQCAPFASKHPLLFR